MPTCVHCSIRFPMQENLQAHLEQQHLGSANKVARACISCPPPGNVFVDLEQHFKDSHNVVEHSYPCPWCKRKFSLAARRNNHQIECLDKPEEVMLFG